MVVYNSQYRKHYKDPRWDEYAVSEYSRKLDYRIGRRSVEHQHEPWSWDSEDEGSEVDQTSSRGLERCQTPKENKKKKGTSNEKKKGAKAVEKIVHSTAEKKQKQHRQKEPRKPSRHIKRTTTSKTEAAVNASNDSNTKSTQIRREPFVSYGWANTGPIGEKYTYNVRASPEEVYPASLRALKRRELDVKQKQIESERKATIEKELLREKFFKHCWVSPTFLTEYQRSYCLHNDEKTDWE